MSDYNVIEDDEAILLKCPDCGKFKDAIAFAPQLPARLAPDGFVKCECVPHPYNLPNDFPPMALMLGAMAPYQPREVRPGVWEHTFTLTYPVPEDMNATFNSFAFGVMPAGQLTGQVRGRAKGSFIRLSHQLLSQRERERRRKQITRRQRRADFRRRKRGLA